MQKSIKVHVYASIIKLFSDMKYNNNMHVVNIFFMDLYFTYDSQIQLLELR